MLCQSIGRKGYWGFPGVLAAPWFVFKNIASLGANGALSNRQIVLSLYYGVLLGWLRIAGFLLAFLLLLAVILRLAD